MTNKSRTTELLRVDKLSQLEAPTKIQQVQKLQALEVLYATTHITNPLYTVKNKRTSKPKKEPTPFNWNIRATFKE